MLAAKTTSAATIYNLSTLFDELTADIDARNQKLSEIPVEQHDWMYSPKLGRDINQRILNQVKEWIDQGYEYAATVEAFADRDLTVNPNNLMGHQFGKVAFPKTDLPCRVTPLETSAVRSLNLDI